MPLFSAALLVLLVSFGGSAGPENPNNFCSAGLSSFCDCCCAAGLSSFCDFCAAVAAAGFAVASACDFCAAFAAACLAACSCCCFCCSAWMCSRGVHSVHTMKAYIDAGLRSTYAMDRCHATAGFAALRWWRAPSLTSNRHAMCTEGRSHPGHAATLTLRDSAPCASACCALPASSRDFPALPAASWRRGTTGVRDDVQLASHSLQLSCR